MSARVLHNCTDTETKIYTSTLVFNDYVGKVVALEEYAGCWYVEDELELTTGEELTITDCFFSCEDCAKIAYQLTDCTGRLTPRYSTQDFESLVGKIIKVPYYDNACFTVSLVRYDQQFTYEEITYSNVYDDCISCRHKKIIEPKETTSKCDINTLRKTRSSFSEAMHQEVMSKRFGVEFCCLTDKIKWWIKNKILDFNLMADDNPELPEPYVESCCIQVEAPCVLPQNNCNTCDPVISTITPVDCNCNASVDSPHDSHCYTVVVTQAMLDDATGNTNTKTNAKVYLGYIPHGETDAVTVAFDEEISTSYCILGLPILGWFKDNEWVNAEAESLVRNDVCESNDDC